MEFSMPLPPRSRPHGAHSSPPHRAEGALRPLPRGVVRLPEPDEQAGRMSPISHTGKLPWVQLRNAIFHPNIFKKMIGRVDPRTKNGDLVYVYDRDGNPFGTGLYSERAGIGV